MMTNGSATTTRPNTGISGTSTVVEPANHTRNLSDEFKDGYTADTNGGTHKTEGRYQPLIAPKLEREEGENNLPASGAQKPTLKEVEDEFGWTGEDEKMG